MDANLLYVGYHEQSTEEYVQTPRSRRHVNVAFEDMTRELRLEVAVSEPADPAQAGYRDHHRKLPLFTQTVAPEFAPGWSDILAHNPPLPGDVDTRWAP